MPGSPSSSRSRARGASALRRARRRVGALDLRLRWLLFNRRTRVTPRPDLAAIGTPYGGYALPTSLLDEDSVCYLVGLGEDASFDLALIERFGCVVHAFDPVPRSQEYGAGIAAREPRFVLHRYGVWSEDTTLEFHAPEDPSYVSHSATNVKGTAAAFVADVRSLPTIMRELGHDRIDLLKVSAEGAEFAIVDHLLELDLRVPVVCVEFTMPAPTARIERTCARLADRGYQTVALSGSHSNWKMTFVLAESAR